MLEKIVDDKDTQKAIEVAHPSSARVFEETEDSWSAQMKRNRKIHLEELSKEDPQTRGDKMLHYTSHATGAALHYGLLGIAGIVEGAARVGETALTGITKLGQLVGLGKLASYLGKKAYDRLPPDSTTKAFVDHLDQELKQNVPAERVAKRRKWGDRAVIAASIATVAFPTYWALSSDSKPKPADDPRPPISGPRVAGSPSRQDRQQTPRYVRPARTPARTRAPRADGRDTGPIRNFQTGRNVLVYCYSNYELQRVKGTFRNRGYRIANNQATKRIAGKNMHFDFVAAGQRIPNRRYGIISLRGHTSNMMPLYRTANRYAATNTVVHMGGCESDLFLPQMRSRNRAIFGIGRRVVTDTDLNTGMFVDMMHSILSRRNWGQVSYDLCDRYPGNTGRSPYWVRHFRVSLPPANRTCPAPEPQYARR
ncbi:hypothetical protein ACFL0V_02030 [Nanoarchaeota archaeon]